MNRITMTIGFILLLLTIVVFIIGVTLDFTNVLEFDLCYGIVMGQLAISVTYWGAVGIVRYYKNAKKEEKTDEDS